MAERQRAATDPSSSLEAALRDAIGEMEDMLGYVPAYFRAKWGYDEAIERAKAALPCVWSASSPSCSPAAPTHGAPSRARASVGPSASGGTASI
jgi:hypothetical protein